MVAIYIVYYKWNRLLRSCKSSKTSTASVFHLFTTEYMFVNVIKQVLSKNGVLNMYAAEDVLGQGSSGKFVEVVTAKSL